MKKDYVRKKCSTGNSHSYNFFHSYIHGSITLNDGNYNNSGL